MAGKSSSNIQDKVLFFLMIFIIIGLIISAYFLFEKKIRPELVASSESVNSNPLLASNNNADEVKKSNNVEENREEYIPETEADVIMLYFGGKGEDKLISEGRRVRRNTSLIARATQIVNGILSGPKNFDGVRILPKGLSLRAIFFEGGTFTLDMSGEFSSIEQLGAGEETLAVYSIVNALTELDPKARVKFLINGTEPNFESGHLDLSIPLRRIDSLIK